MRSIDSLGNVVIKRRKPCITRYHYLRLEDGEAYFYHQLLLSKPWRSEDEIAGQFDSYQEHFQMLFPEAFDKAVALANQETAVETVYMQDVYIWIIDSVVAGIKNQGVNDIIKMQLNALKQSP